MKLREGKAGWQMWRVEKVWGGCIQAVADFKQRKVLIWGFKKLILVAVERVAL